VTRLLSSAKKLFTPRGERKNEEHASSPLLTPRAYTPSLQSLSSPSSLLSSKSNSSNFASNVFAAEESEGFDDGVEEVENDNGTGDPKNLQDSNGGQLEYIVMPQKKDLYHAAKKKMLKEREQMLKDKFTINVQVKTKQAYEFGGRVEGRKGGAFESYSGTIIDVICVD